MPHSNLSLNTSYGYTSTEPITTPANTDWWTLYDICSIGQDLYPEWNGKFSFNINDGITGLAYWPHAADWYDVEFINGAAYGYSGTRYTLKYNDAKYAYCSLNGTYPDNCNNNWVIWDGKNWIDDTDWTVLPCRDIEYRTDCDNETYVSEILGISNTDEYCISETSVRSDIETTFEYLGCYEGMPYYGGTNNVTGFYMYLYFYWDATVWFIGPTLGSTYVYAECYSYDLLNCNNDDTDFWAWNYTISSWQIDNNIQIDLCETPVC